jgi:hypothetical protein
MLDQMKLSSANQRRIAIIIVSRKKGNFLYGVVEKYWKQDAQQLCHQMCKLLWQWYRRSVVVVVDDGS